MIRKAMSTLILIGVFTAANAEVCNHVPGAVTCGKGTVSSLSGNGVITVKDTTVEGATQINGKLNAENSNFSFLNINGSATLFQCTVNQDTEIKGELKSSSTKFEKNLDIFSNSTRFINSKVANNLQIRHTHNKNQEVYLDNNSVVGGDIVFDDDQGKVYVRDGSKIGGKVIGGEVLYIQKKR